MKTQLKKRIENLEAKASSVAQKQKPESEADMAASFDKLREGFKAILAKSQQRDTLPLAEQLRIHREELEAILTQQAEQKLRATQDARCLDDGFLLLKERMKRRVIQELEACVLDDCMSDDVRP